MSCRAEYSFLIFPSNRSPLERAGDILNLGAGVRCNDVGVHTKLDGNIIFEPYNRGCRFTSVDITRQRCLEALLDYGHRVEWNKSDL